jgi:hypothetical protein
MENQTCPLHQVPLFGKEWNGTMLYSHIIKDVGFCNGKKITPFKPQVSPQPSLPQQPLTPPITREPLEAPDWEKIAEGKVRNSVITSQIQYGGLDSLKGQLPKVERVVSYIMTGRYDEAD